MELPIRVLHIFAPNVRSRFGGQTITWKHAFSRWDDHTVVHSVLDCKNSRVVDSRLAFDFEYPDQQEAISRWGRAAWIPSLFRNLTRLEKQHDILHVHVLWWGGLLIGPWARWKNIPALYESVLLDADTPGSVLGERFGGLQVRCLKRYEAILAISEYLAEDYRKSGFREEQVFTLMNSVDTTVFSPVATTDERLTLRRKLDLPQDATVLVFVGSVIQRKGADVLVRAFIEASARRSDLHLLVVGPRQRSENPSLDEDFVNKLRALLRKNDLSERVSFTGIVQNRQQVAEMYRASDIFVFPSNKEGLGNVVLEAMASGLPVVVSNLPVLEKVIRHQENGFLVPVDNSAALSDAILMVSSDRVLAERLGRNARDYVEKNHSFAAWQARLTEFYRGLLF